MDDTSTEQETVRRSTWLPIPNLKAVAAGRESNIQTDLVWRDDGKCLLYRRKLCILCGEPEAGKSLVALAAGAQVIVAGGKVVFIDVEDSAESLAGRLNSFGVDAVATAEVNWFFIHPEEGPTNEELRAMVEAIAAIGPDLVVVDSSNETMSLLGLDLSDNKEATNFYRSLRAIAGRGPCVLMIDHVTKNRDNRRGYAIGAQAKKAALNGVQYEVMSLECFVPDKGGSALLRVSKDRPGGVNSFAERKTRTAAIFKLESRWPELGTRPVFVAPPTNEDDPKGHHSLLLDCRAAIMGALADEAPQALRLLRNRVSSGLRPFIDEALAALAGNALVEVIQEKSDSGQKRKIVHRCDPP